MTSPVIIGDCHLYLGDAVELLPRLPMVDACVTDPPYGIKEAAGKNGSRSKPFGGAALKMPGKTIIAHDYGDDAWDNEPIPQEVFDLIRSRSMWQIVFGGNYYSFPPSSCWLVWDKRNGASDFADCELAWTNLPKAVRRIDWMWNGMLRKGNEPRGFHPTQKPIGVMEWCIEQLPLGSELILDPFMGSGTTGVACVRLGKKFVGMERESKYFDIACRRISDAVSRPDLFIETSNPPEPYTPSLFNEAAE